MSRRRQQDDEQVTRKSKRMCWLWAALDRKVKLFFRNFAWLACDHKITRILEGAEGVQECF